MAIVFIISKDPDSRSRKGDITHSIEAFLVTVVL